MRLVGYLKRKACRYLPVAPEEVRYDNSSREKTNKLARIIHQYLIPAADTAQ